MSAAAGDLITIEAATADRFEDLRTMVGPKSAGAAGCWCLSHRLPSPVHTKMTPDERCAAARSLTEQPVSPGVLAYRGAEVVGWAGIAPRSEVASITRSTKIPVRGDGNIWALWCVKTRPGYRKQGISHHLVRGAVTFAREHGAIAVEAYPVDNGSRRVNPTLAYVGTRGLFAAAGFAQIAETEAVSDGMPRVVMRLTFVGAEDPALSAG